MSIQGNIAQSALLEPAIRPIPSEGARFVVTIDGKPYAGFVNRLCAEQAVRMWLGEIDAGGMPVPPSAQERHAWRGVRGRKVKIVER
jgi:hypothetical protein